MDEQVIAAMKRWPDVPDVYGWLRLDRRGRWCLIDRNQPGFDAERDGRGSPITNPQINDFIGRNYLRDADGCWYWQNGPQRAFVELDAAPWICRVIDSPAGQRLLTQTGEVVERVEAAAIDAQGILRVLTEFGPAAVHDLDLAQLTLDVEDGRTDRGSWQWNGCLLALTEPDERMLDFIASPMQHHSRR